MKLERYNLIILVLTAWLALSTGVNAFGQADRRSEGTPVTLRVDSDPAAVPCAGVTVFEEGFDNGFPAGWQVIDGDGLTPRSEMGLAPGFQVLTDYRDTSNNVMASPSWYDNGGGVSNDWLISPQITLGSNPCFSWTAYSQDGGFPEAYEVYLATTGSDTSDFLAGTRIDTVATEIGDYTIRALNLDNFANQNVYLAFRQISDDKFVLALDNIKISNIEPVDIGATSVSYGSPSPGDTLTFVVGVANYGSDIVTSFDLCYSIDGSTPSCVTVDTFTLEPNQSVSVTHSVEFVSDTLDAFYTFCAYTENPNNGSDNDASNDTLCQEISVGSPVGIGTPQFQSLEMTAYPNPTSGILNLQIESNRESVNIQLFGVDGKKYLERETRSNQGEIALDLESLPKGIYLLRAESEKGKVGTARIILD